MSDSDHDLEQAMWQANYECDWVADRTTVELCARVAREAIDTAVAEERKRLLNELRSHIELEISQRRLPDFRAGLRWTLAALSGLEEP